MFNFKCVLFLYLSLSIFQANAGLVDFVDPCHYNDSPCILKSSNKALPYITAGIPKFDIPSFDPLVIDNINGDNGDLKLKLKNVKISTLPKCEITRIGRPDKLKLELELVCPVTVTGQYDLSGKLLVLDVEGNGDFIIKSDQMKFSVDVNSKVVEKNGQEYYKFNKYDYKFDLVKKVYITFQNLFNGDKAKADPVISILDESWKEITSEVGKPIFKEIISQIMNGIQKLYSHVPRKELELE